MGRENLEIRDSRHEWRAWRFNVFRIAEFAKLFPASLVLKVSVMMCIARLYIECTSAVSCGVPMRL